jgi:hypothetical protein
MIDIIKTHLRKHQQPPYQCHGIQQNCGLQPSSGLAYARIFLFHVEKEREMGLQSNFN